jgi:hypothetical protein
MTDKEAVKNQMKITNTIFVGLTSGLIVFFIVAVYLMQNKFAVQAQVPDTILTFLVPVFGLLMMSLSRLLYKKFLSRLSPDKDLIQKLIQYRTSKIISWAMIEAAALPALIASILTLNYLYIAVFVLLFGYFLLSRPTRESFVKDFRLTSDESEIIFKS